MLKFVSKKPPKGKQPMQSLDYPPESHQIRHINTRQYFRPRAFSSESGGPQVYDYHLRRDDKSFIHQSPVLKRHQVRHGSNSNIIRNGDENDNVPPEYMADLPPPHPHHHHHHQHTQHAHHYPPPPPNIFHPQGQYYQHHQQQNNSQQNNHQQQHHHHQQHQQQHHHQHFQQNGHSSMDSLDLSHEAISGIYSPDDTMSSEHPHHPHYPHFPQHHHPHGGLKKRSVEGEEHHRHRTGVSYRHVTWSPEVKDEGQRLDHLGHEDFEARRKFEATTVHEDPSMYREREQRARFYPVPMVQTGQLGHVDDLDYDNNNYSIDQVNNKSVDHKLNNSKNNNVFKPLSVTTSIFSSRSQNSPPIKSSCAVFVDTTQSSSIYVTPAVQSPQPGMEVRSYITPYGSIACHVTKTPSSTTTTTTDSKEEGDQSRTKHVNVEKKFLKEDEGPNDYDDTLGPLAPNGLFSNSNLPLLTSSPNQSESDINYAYYTTLPAKLSNYSNFVFSPYSFSTPKKTEIEQEMKYMKEKQRERTVDDASKVQETRTRLPSLSPTGQKDTKYLHKDVKDEDEYDNISMETDKVYYEKHAKPRFDQNLRENNSKHVKNIVSMAANHENTMETSHQGVQDTSTSLDSHLSSESTGTSVTRETVPEAATPSSSSSSGRKSNRVFPRLFLLQDRSDHRDKVSHDSSVTSHGQTRLSHDQQVHVSDKQISGTNTLTSREAQSQGHVTHHLHSQDPHPHHQQQQHQQQQQQHHSHENIFSQGLKQLSKAFGRDNKHKHKHGSDSDSKTRMEGEEREVTTKEGVIPPVVPPRKISLDRFFYFTKALEKSRHGSDQKKQQKTSSKENSQEEMEMPVIYQQARKVQGPNNASERSRTVETHEYNMSPKTREHPSFEEISRSSYDHSRSFGQGQPDVSSWSFQGHDLVDYSASDNTDYDHYADQYMKQHRGDSGQVMTSCVPQTNHDLSTNDLLRRQYQFKDASSTSGSMLSSGNMSSMRDMINRSRDLNAEDGQLVLDLVYVTERLISMSFPSEGHEATYQSNLQEVMAMLRSKHGENCLVLNISEPRQDLEQWNPKHVIDYGWPDFLAPPLERLCNICKAMDSWLNSDPHHVVVIHCKGSNSRIALIVAAFMHYNSICASSDQALDRFAMKRFYEEKLGGISQPSQSRYVQYFHGLLSGSIKINSNALYLHHIVIHGVPNFDTNGGCRPFIKVYQGMQCIFTSGVYKVTDQMQKVCISISPGIPLRGDIMIKCFHKMPRTGDRESVWACQFHTCAIMGYNLVFAKKDLDDARTDPRFPDSGKVEFVFGNTQDGHVGVTDFKSDVTVPVDEQGETNVARRNSFENFLQTDVNRNGLPSANQKSVQMTKLTNHAEGPVDGSLYAMVTKRRQEEHTQTSSGHVMQNGSAHNYQFNQSHALPGMEPHVHGMNNHQGFMNSHESDGGSFAYTMEHGVVGNSVADSSNTTSRTMKTTTTTTTSTINNNNNNNEEKAQKGYNSSMNTSKSSYSSSSSGTKKTVPPLDEQTQLDLILSDLLNEQVFVTSPSGSKSGTNGSKETRTFRTYDTHTSPEGKTSYQAAEVTYKIPGGFREEKSYSMTKSEEKQAYVPPNAFSYTTSPELARKGYGPTSPELIRKAESPKTRTLPYRTDYDNRYYTDSYRTMESGGSLSPTDTSSSWLYEQQQKLRQRKDSKDEKTVEQERQLVEELKTAQNRFIQQKNQKQNEERVTMDTYHSKASSPPPVANGPTTTYNYQVSRSPTYFHHTSQGSVSSPLNTGESTTTYTYRTESKTTSSSSGINKAPPSPGLSRQIISPVAAPPSVGHVSAPVSPPIRSSSKDYMQRNRSTSTSSWQSGRSTYNKQNLVHEHEIRPPIVKSISITTPPLSPRLSPRQQHTVQSPPPTQHPPPLLPQQPAGPGTSYHVDTIQKINTIISEPMVQQHQIKTSHTSKSNSNTMLHHAPTKTKTTEVQEVDLKDGNKKSNYITEVYINRSPGRGGAESTSKSHTTTIERHVDRGDKESNRLDELEKTLQAASNSIMASQPWQQQSSANKSYSTMERHVTRRYETREVRNTQQQQQQSENKQIVSSNEKGFASDVSPQLVQHQHHQQSMSPEFENRNRSMSPVWDNMHVSTSTIVPLDGRPKEVPHERSYSFAEAEKNFTSLLEELDLYESQINNHKRKSSTFENTSNLSSDEDDFSVFEASNLILTCDLSDYDTDKVKGQTLSNGKDTNGQKTREKESLDKSIPKVSPVAKGAKSRDLIGQKDGFKACIENMEASNTYVDHVEKTVFESPPQSLKKTTKPNIQEDVLNGNQNRLEPVPRILVAQTDSDSLVHHSSNQAAHGSNIRVHLVNSYPEDQENCNFEEFNVDRTGVVTNEDEANTVGGARCEIDTLERKGSIPFMQYLEIRQSQSRKSSMESGYSIGCYYPEASSRKTSNASSMAMPSSDSDRKFSAGSLSSGNSLNVNHFLENGHCFEVRKTSCYDNKSVENFVTTPERGSVESRGSKGKGTSQGKSEDSVDRLLHEVEEAQEYHESASAHSYFFQENKFSRQTSSDSSKTLRKVASEEDFLSKHQQLSLEEEGVSEEDLLERARLHKSSSTPSIQSLSQLSEVYTGSTTGSSLSSQHPLHHAESVAKSSASALYKSDQSETTTGFSIGQSFKENKETSANVTDIYSTVMKQPGTMAKETKISQSEKAESFNTGSGTLLSCGQTKVNGDYHKQTTEEFAIEKTQQVHTAPPPKQISVVEEDRISLRPIGPGVTNLEPEGMVGTLGRSGATTPSFPISPVQSAETLIQSVHEKVRRMSMGSRQDLRNDPLGSRQDLHVTPPFPVSPRTPYVNQAPTPSSISPVSPGDVFLEDEAYNRIVSAQMLRGSEPVYASIPARSDSNSRSLQGHPGSQQQQQQMFMTQTVHREHQETNQQPQQHFTHVEQHRETGNQQQQHHVPLEIQVQHQNPPHMQNFQNQGHHQEQHQQYSYHTQQQHHHGGSDAHRQGLHVDTSNRMVGHGMTARTPTSPPSPGSFNTLRQQLSVGGTMSPTSHSVTGQSSPSLYFGTSRRGSISSLADSEPSHITTPRFVRDTSKYWYKPHISREEAITMLKDKAPGAFVVRDSNSYPGAFGLALKVSQIPPNVQTKSTGDPSADLVRHFLIEPTHKGVRLRGSSNEPIFGSLASLVYQHSITPLSLPCKLVLPDAETIAADNASMVDGPSRTDLPGSPAALLAQGAACNVLYITSVDTESLTGPQAVSRAMKLTLDSQPLPKTTVVHFKVSSQGITLTDNQRKLFFRRHYPVTAVTYCGLDPEARKWRSQNENGQIVEAKVFGFIARKSGGVSDNACHLFAELDPEQPASAIVNFVSKVMIGHSKVKC